MNNASKLNCDQARADLASGISIEDEYALYFFEKPSFFDYHPKRDIILAAVTHIKSCTGCEQWLRAQVSPETFDRAERASKYCCISMFAAVEEPERARVSLSFHLFRNEDPCWCIDNKSVFAGFCPWCGVKMPAHPFREGVGIRKI